MKRGAKVMQMLFMLVATLLVSCGQSDELSLTPDAGTDANALDMTFLSPDASDAAPRKADASDTEQIQDVGDESEPDLCCDEEPTLRVETLEPFQGELMNPERGFYEPVSLMEQTNFDYVRQAGQTVIFSYVRLDEFRDRSLPQAFLGNLEASLDRVRAADLKLILRFSYNFGPYPNSEPDAPLTRVLEHIEQVRPVLEDHRDVIMVVQAGFIGAWGEWHTSTNDLTTPQNRETILRALLDAVPLERMVQIRYPSAKVDVFGDAPLMGAQAFSGMPAARVGHHNDCFLSSANDVGTYGRGDASMAEELAYLEEETKFVPMGGETCAVNPPRSACASTLAEMQRLHFSYINLAYHGDVVDGWRAGGCFDEIRDRLGYRLAVTEVAHSECVRPGGQLSVRLDIENRGYAAPFNSRPVRLVLRNGDTTIAASVDGADLRGFGPGSHSVEAMLGVPEDISDGDWELALWLPDAAESLETNPAYAIRLANEDVWDGSVGYNVLGTQCVSSQAPGSLGPGSPDFVEL